MNNFTWVKFDLKNLPKHTRLLATNGNYVKSVEFGFDGNMPYFHNGTGQLLDVIH